MKIDTTHLLSAIEDYIVKADEDLRDTLESEGFVAASETVRHIGEIEDALEDVLDEDALEFLERVKEAEGVDEFLSVSWPDIKNESDLEKALYEIFRQKFDEMFRSFTFSWILAEEPEIVEDISGEAIDTITKPAEAFIKGWSGELSRIMNLNTKDSMEKMLLKAQKKSEKEVNKDVRIYNRYICRRSVRYIYNGFDEIIRTSRQKNNSRRQ